MPSFNIIFKRQPVSFLANKPRTLASVAKDSPFRVTPPAAPASPIASNNAQAEPPLLSAALRLKTGEVFKATSFGSPLSKSSGRMSGEVVFTTSLVGYPESMTDPSYRGQILVFTQPLIGNYGVPTQTRDAFGLLEHFESGRIQCQGIVVNDYATKYSHWTAVESLGQWCARHGIPAISGVDTRAVVSLLRDRGSTLGEIVVGNINSTPTFEDPNLRNLCSEVSVKSKEVYNPTGELHIALVDCGVKQNIIRCLAKRGAKVTVLPWDHDLSKDTTVYDGVFLSNGPGDPRVLTKSAENLKAYMKVNETRSIPIPIFGICMGNLVMGMAVGYNVYKLPYGNRGHNQPAIDLTTGKCQITSQNHGYALDDSANVPGWVPYFRNANDGSNEGIRHTVLPYTSVQFHPEAMGGPEDTDYLFSNFMNEVRALKRERKRESFGKSINLQAQAVKTVRV
ncbi:class I glutamine amidotransferase-like protein [Chytridium lagenaria]|nr:class I glutamine amidotransferase-like protein [Chytridium lagenaria]